MKIEFVVPEYTGGGIYCFTGKLDDGNYFLADCPMSADVYSVRIINADPSKYDANDVWTEDWQAKHFVKDIAECKDFIIDMITLTMTNAPDGNYLASDMETILQNLKETKTMCGQYEAKAEELKTALTKLTKNETVLDNFISYVSYHGDEWYDKYCSNLDGLVSELTQFASITE